MEHDPVKDVLMHLAVCHTIVIDKNTGEFNAASPDELALVEGARDFGFEFLGKQKDGSLYVSTPEGVKLSFRVLNVLEFNSTRKRMSVIVRDQ